jgi:hypothetical protein
MELYVDMSGSRISYSYIETDALSTYLGMLMDDVIENTNFCFSWRSLEVNELPAQVEQYGPYTTFYVLFRTVNGCIRRSYGENTDSRID